MNSENKKISIIVPVYNVESYLPQCIESILKQTYQNLEVILVNDGSTDNSLSICKRYQEQDSRVQVLHKENGGLSDARNAGLDIATGEYIGFVDSDDFIDLDMYEILYTNAEKYDADISMCWSKDFPSKRKCTFSSKVEVLDTKESVIKKIYLSRRTAMAICLKLFKREIFDNIRFKKGITTEDGEIFLSLVKKIDRMVIQDNAKYNYRQRDNSITHQRAYSKKILDLTRIYEQNEMRIKREYNGLDEVAAYKKWWAYRDTILRLGKVIPCEEQKEEINNVQKKIRNGFYAFMSNPYMTVAQKVATVVAMFSSRLYVLLRS